MKSTKMYINEKLNQYVTAKGIKQIYISQATGISADIISKMLARKKKNNGWWISWNMFCVKY